MGRPPSSLSTLPADVLLDILRFCGLADNLSFSMVCTGFYNFSMQRVYWLNALQEARLIRPIACPFREDLTQHDLQSLKRIAFHTIRLEHNWSLPEPQIKRPVKAVVLGTPLLDVIFQVPGTELYVFHSHNNGMIAAWDIRLGRRVSPEIFISPRVLDVSPGQDEAGKFSVGLLTRVTSTTAELVVVCLEYGPEGVNLSVTSKCEFEPDVHVWAVFMTTGYVGVLRRNSSDVFHEGSTIDIVALNLSSGRKTVIHTDLGQEMFKYETSQSATSILDGVLFVLVEWDDESFLYPCPKDYLPHDDNPMCPPNSVLKCRGTSSTVLWGRQDLAVEFVDAEGALSADGFYGVPAVSLQKIRTPNEHVTFEDDSEDEDMDGTSQIQIRFWMRPGPEDADFPPHLSPKHYINIPGCLQDSPDSSWKLMLLPHSGRKVLIVVNVDSRMSLQLVHFDPEEGKISVQPIAMPPFINIEEVYGMSLDDNRV